MNYLTSIVRKATRKSGDSINILILAEDTKPPELEGVYCYGSVRPGIDYDLVICDQKHLKEAAQFAMANHLSLLKTDILAQENILEILEAEAKRPYLNHPYDDKT